MRGAIWDAVNVSICSSSMRDHMTGSFISGLVLVLRKTTGTTKQSISRGERKVCEYLLRPHTPGTSTQPVVMVDNFKGKVESGERLMVADHGRGFENGSHAGQQQQQQQQQQQRKMIHPAIRRCGDRWTLPADQPTAT